MNFRQIIFVPHENIEKHFRTPSWVLHFCKKSKISQIVDKKAKIVNIYSLKGFNNMSYIVQCKNDRRSIL